MLTTVRLDIDVKTDLVSEVDEVALMDHLPHKHDDMEITEIRGKIVASSETIWTATVDDIRGYEVIAAGETQEQAREAMRLTWERLVAHFKRAGEPLMHDTFDEFCEYHEPRYTEVPLGVIGIYGDSSAERLVV